MLSNRTREKLIKKIILLGKEKIKDFNEQTVFKMSDNELGIVILNILDYYENQSNENKTN